LFSYPALFQPFETRLGDLLILIRSDSAHSDAVNDTTAAYGKQPVKRRSARAVRDESHGSLLHDLDSSLRAGTAETNNLSPLRNNDFKVFTSAKSFYQTVGLPV
jgi:hypothetical protein